MDMRKKTKSLLTKGLEQNRGYGQSKEPEEDSKHMERAITDGEAQVGTCPSP